MKSNILVFINRVKQMRNAQKKYFSFKYQRDLFACKALEKEVDQFILELSDFIEEESKRKNGEQLDIFNK